MMLELIKSLDSKTSDQRRKIILDELQTYFSNGRIESPNLKLRQQIYSTGNNIIIDAGSFEKKIGVSCHFDTVPGTGGANDNASAIAVVFDILEKLKNSSQDLGVRLFFFDEEETGLKGSNAYVDAFGTDDMIGLINLEMIGIGDKLALWSLTKDIHGVVLNEFENSCEAKDVKYIRLPDIVTNTADHVPFRNGIADSFSVTCLSDQDLVVAQRYYQHLYTSQNPSQETLLEILSHAPIFQHYHQASDLVDNINIDSLNRVSDIVWQTIKNIHEKR